MTKIMVVGASGILGQFVCQELINLYKEELDLIITDYKAERGNQVASHLNHDVEFKKLDVSNVKDIHRVINNIDCVIVTIKQEQPYIQETCIRNKIRCIDVTPYSAFVDKVKIYEQEAQKNKIPSIVMSGFVPGLSGLMVKKSCFTITKDRSCTYRPFAKH